MKYWDASAIVPLIIAEPHTTLTRSWLSRDSGIVTWAWTRVEIASAIERRAREGLLTGSQRREALDRFAALAEAWDEVTDVLAARGKALQLLARHPLRAADSAQLAAALLVADPDPAVTEHSNAATEEHFKSGHAVGEVSMKGRRAEAQAAGGNGRSGGDYASGVALLRERSR